jgi:DNA repair protein RadC
MGVYFMKYDIVSTRRIRKTIKITHPSTLFPLLKRYAKNQECFLVITLNGGNDIISISIVTIGLVNRTIIHPREVFIKAIEDRSSAIIIEHNHPSGNLKPSPEDDDVTKSLLEASKIIGIKLVDHIIFTKKEYYSYSQNNNL